MAGIKGKNTKPELLVRKLLTTAGVPYRLHRKDLPGAPDIVVPSRQVAIFVHGCFWHVHATCRFAKWPTSRPDFWRAKLSGNASRDSDAAAMLNMLGWRVLVVWECSTRLTASADLLQCSVLSWLTSDEPYGEIGEEHLARQAGTRV